MRAEKKQPGASGLSRGMRMALIVTLILTVLSFGIRKWRQASNEPPVAAAQDKPNSNRVMGTSSPASDQPSTNTSLRQEVPAASANPMTRRNLPPPPPQNANTNKPPPPPPPPPPPKLDPPAFRLIGAHVDGKRWTAFFAHGNSVIAARPKTELPGGFMLKSINRNSATVIRRANQEKIEMPLEMPK